MAVNDTYDVGAAFKAIEDRLIDSMMRNFEKHKDWETAEGFDWTAWQAEQLRSMEDYRLANQKIFGPEFREINERIPELIEWARKQGNANEEINLLKNLGAKRKPPGAGQVGFFGVNDRKINALIKATKADFERGEYAVLRKANDEYKKIIFNAQVYANSGAGTYEQAVDMATKDFLSRGIQSIRYSNGATHKMSDYADMAIKTAAKRAYLVGEGEMRDEWGEHLVVINPRVDACPDCMEFQGRVFIDDVYSGGSAKDGNYPMLSEAIAGGLYHPRCRDIHSTYYEGISSPPEAPTKKDVEAAEDNEQMEMELALATRNAERYGRLAKYSLDPDNKRMYSQKEKEWTKAKQNVIDEINSDTIKAESIKYTGEGIEISTENDTILLKNELVDRGAFVMQNELLARNSLFIDPIEGYVDIVCHSSPTEFCIKYGEIDIDLSISQFAEMIRKSSKYNNSPIRIISCQAGAYNYGAAKELAQELGHDVLAATEDVYVDEKGRIFVTDNETLAEMWHEASEEDKHLFRQTGSWKLFTYK